MDSKIPLKWIDTIIAPFNVTIAGNQYGVNVPALGTASQQRTGDKCMFEKVDIRMMIALPVGLYNCFFRVVLVQTRGIDIPSFANMYSLGTSGAVDVTSHLMPYQHSRLKVLHDKTYSTNVYSNSGARYLGFTVKPTMPTAFLTGTSTPIEGGFFIQVITDGAGTPPICKFICRGWFRDV